MTLLKFKKNSRLQERSGLLLVIGINGPVSLFIPSTEIFLLYIAAFEVTRGRLIDTVKSQSLMMEALADFGALYSTDYPGGAKAATLSQIIDANENFEGLGETGEFVLAELKDGKIVFLLTLRYSRVVQRESVPFDSE